ncbi:hypothetical protein [Erwinia sp. CGal63]|uniref:hypothetical protein n=1 Tax=Erwinia sp. CGal63 TaxID=2919889 RepID=UPI00300B1C58
MKELESLEKEFCTIQNNQKDKHDELLNDSQGKISECKYSDRILINFYPFESEIYGLKKGKELKEINKTKKSLRKNYFDSNGRLIMVEGILADERVTSRDFYYYREGFLERVSFQKIGSFKIKSLARYYNSQEGCKLVNKAVMGESYWDFNLSNNQLISILVNERQSVNDDFQEREVVFCYNEKNELDVIINKYKNGSSQVIYDGNK